MTTKKTILAIMFLVACFALEAFGQEAVAAADRTQEWAAGMGSDGTDRYSAIDVRLGVGATLSPETVLLLGSSEIHLDHFFSLGPAVQVGLSQDEQLFIPTLGGRFILPAELGRDVEFSLRGGAGALYRYDQGDAFWDFVYEAGLHADVFVMKGLTVGLGSILNLTGSRVEGVILSLFASVAYRF